MGYNLRKQPIILAASERRIFFKHKNIVRFSYPLMVLFGFFLAVSLIAPAFAIETTKIAAYVPEEGRGDYPLFPTPKPPHLARNVAKTDPCLSFLDKHIFSDAKDSNSSNRSGHYQPYADKTAAPVTLSFLLGMRRALSPQKLSKKISQPAMQKHDSIGGRYPRTLAIAAYRGCKNKQALTMK